MKLLIWGIEGVAHEVLKVLAQTKHPYQQIAFVYDGPNPPQHILDYPVIGNRSVFSQIDVDKVHVFPAATTPITRKVFVEYLLNRGVFIPSFISPTAIIRNQIKFGKGILIQNNASVDNYAEIGDYSLIGNWAVVGHHSVIGPFANLYIRSILLGHVKMGEGALLGANACVMNYKKLGNWSKAAMSAAVFEDVPDFATVQGNPAQIIKQHPGMPPTPKLWDL